MSKKFLVLTVAIFAGLSLCAFSNDGPDLCTDCHSDKATSLEHTAHAIEQPTSGALGSVFKVECTDCHEGWQAHIEEPRADNIVNPASISFARQSNVCGRCHQTPHQSAFLVQDPHAKAGIYCTFCHTIHDNQARGLVKDDADKYCLTCHPSVAQEFRQRSAHPLHSRNIRCASCHSSSATKSELTMVGFEWTCRDCHSEKSGPYTFEHPVAYEHLVQGGGCLECHQAHGSPNDRLLKQPGSELCRQCHATPPGHLAQHSGLGGKLACTACHTDIHGSFTSRTFLDPNLGVRLFPDCFQSGCHVRQN